MVTEWDFPLEEVLHSRLTLLEDFHPEVDLGEDLNPHLTRLMDHHPEADLGQGHQSSQDHQGHCCHRLDHQGCYMLITCYEAIFQNTRDAEHNEEKSCTYSSSSSPGSSGSSPGGGGGGRAPGGGGGSGGTIEGSRPGVLPPVGSGALPPGGGIGGEPDGVGSGGLPDEIGIGTGTRTVSVLLLLETLDEEPEFAVDVVLVTLGTLVADPCIRVADSEVDQTDVKVIVSEGWTLESEDDGDGTIVMFHEELEFPDHEVGTGLPEVGTGLHEDNGIEPADETDVEGLVCEAWMVEAETTDVDINVEPQLHDELRLPDHGAEVDVKAVAVTMLLDEVELDSEAECSPGVVLSVATMTNVVVELAADPELGELEPLMDVPDPVSEESEV